MYVRLSLHRFTWPHPRDYIEGDFRNASELEKRKIVKEKVAQLSVFDLDYTCEGGTAMYIDHVGINTNDMEARCTFTAVYWACG